jgi:hypothetical protein
MAKGDNGPRVPSRLSDFRFPGNEACFAAILTAMQSGDQISGSCATIESLSEIGAPFARNLRGEQSTGGRDGRGHRSLDEGACETSRREQHCAESNSDDGVIMVDWPGPKEEVGLIPELARWDARRKAVVVPSVLLRSRQQIECVISQAALATLGIDAEDRAACLKSVGQHCNRIGAAAAGRLLRHGLDPGGELRFLAEDFAEVG